MNLLDRRKAGLIAVLALFLFACESDNIISLPFDPKTENINAHYAELTLPFKLVQIDSINTTVTSNNRKRVLIGNYSNDSFGKIQAIGFTDLGISNKGTISETDVFDSLKLIMVNDYFYGETEAMSPQTFSIYQLTDTLARRFHYSFETVPYNTAPLGSLTFMPDPKATSDPDTLHIKISDAVGQDLFEKAKKKTVEVSTDSAFQSYFKGLAFVPESENNYITGFNPQVRLVLYFSEPNETTSSTYTFGIGPTITFTYVGYDRTGTPIANINNPREAGQATDSNFYLQSGTGLAPMIDFQPLVEFVNNIKYGEEPQNVLLNRVDLYIGSASSIERMPLPPVIRGIEVDENFKTKTFVSSSKQRSVYRGLSADNTNDIAELEASAIEADTLSRYKKQITTYMQFLADSTLKETEFLLLGDDLEFSVNQVVTAPDSVKLKIYYTVLK